LREDERRNGPDVRGAAKRVFGGNCTFSDDDMAMLEHFALSRTSRGRRRFEQSRSSLAIAMEARRGETAKTGSTAKPRQRGPKASPND
jgi:hypothetical protein